MARQLRIPYAGAVHHVMSRGDRREPIFQDDRGRETFLETLGQCCARTGWHKSLVVDGSSPGCFTTPFHLSG